MAAPTIYDESELSDFMIAELRNVATVLGWTDLSDMQEAVNETLIVYGVEDIALASDIPMLRAFARREAWRAAVASLAADYDFEADGGNYKRSQLQSQAVKALALAEEKAAPFEVSEDDPAGSGPATVIATW